MVLVKNVPPDSDESVSELVEHFFLVNHPDHYLTHQVVYNANKLAKLVKEKKSKQNWLEYYQLKYSRNQSTRPMMKIAEERENVTSNPKAIMPAAFVSFKTRWGAAVCAQTQQSRNPTIWLTEWASELRDVYWENLAIPYVSLSIRKLIITVAFFFLTFFFMNPIAFVQSLANIEGIEKEAPFLKAIIEVSVLSFIDLFSIYSFTPIASLMPLKHGIRLVFNHLLFMDLLVLFKICFPSSSMVVLLSGLGWSLGSR
ncbi:hypothetical protein RJ639_046145 [Escallonia herrerae]|uniref:CSC1-like protein n=1 Tax=Escallonia herrerae TaxID=1293975 RepID=A0AA89B4V3_9ASTE|nr:hypothetical protein RJ639_046145 [Escallonia herrerae]